MHMRLKPSTTLLLRNVVTRNQAADLWVITQWKVLEERGRGKLGRSKSMPLLPMFVALCSLHVSIKSLQSATISTRTSCLFCYHLVAGLHSKFKHH